MDRDAEIEGNYRYLLGRMWNPQTPRVVFVMLNPSTADHRHDDKTLKKCIHFAQSWGYGSLDVVNLFAYRTSNPGELHQVPDPVGAKNNYYIVKGINRAEKIVLAWGNHGNFGQRDQEVLQLISGQLIFEHKPVYCLGYTKLGNPRHPRDLPLNSSLVPFAMPLFQLVLNLEI